ncbi:MAG: hypothetical protein II839_01110, partial [Kiritimatiellae bacterium]|nr:hypothetical protein [Kiritimatiellia bacterium]
MATIDVQTPEWREALRLVRAADRAHSSINPFRGALSVPHPEVESFQVLALGIGHQQRMVLAGPEA